MLSAHHWGGRVGIQHFLHQKHIICAVSSWCTIFRAVLKFLIPEDIAHPLTCGLSIILLVFLPMSALRVVFVNITMSMSMLHWGRLGPRLMALLMTLRISIWWQDTNTLNKGICKFLQSWVWLRKQNLKSTRETPKPMKYQSSALLTACLLYQMKAVNAMQQRMWFIWDACRSYISETTKQLHLQRTEFQSHKTQMTMTTITNPLKESNKQTLFFQLAHQFKFTFS